MQLIPTLFHSANNKHNHHRKLLALVCMEAADSAHNVPLPPSPPTVYSNGTLEAGHTLIPTTGDDSGHVVEPSMVHLPTDKLEFVGGKNHSDGLAPNNVSKDQGKNEKPEEVVKLDDQYHSTVLVNVTAERDDEENGVLSTEEKRPNQSTLQEETSLALTLAAEARQPVDVSMEHGPGFSHLQEVQSVPPTPPVKLKDIQEDIAPPRTSHFQSVEETLQAHRRSMTISKGHTVSVVLISAALETIAASKEAKRSPPLRDSTQKALDLLRNNQGIAEPRVIFEPLRLACETKNEKLMIASLDCISKLVSYSFFAESDAHAGYVTSPPSSPRHSGTTTSSTPQPSLVDLVAHTIASCHTETTPETVSLQIVKALLALILSPTTLVHHSSLLKAVRTVYNVYLLSSDPVNQGVAQGGLTQMVQHIFARCQVSQSSKETSDSTVPSAIPTPEPDGLNDKAYEQIFNEPEVESSQVSLSKSINEPSHATAAQVRLTLYALLLNPS